MGFDGISWDFMGFDGISWDLASGKHAKSEVEFINDSPFLIIFVSQLPFWSCDMAPPFGSMSGRDMAPSFEQCSKPLLVDDSLGDKNNFTLHIYIYICDYEIAIS